MYRIILVFCFLIHCSTLCAQDFWTEEPKNPFGTFSLYGVFGPSGFLTSYTGMSLMGFSLDAGFFYQTTSRFHIGIATGLYSLRSDIDAIGSEKLEALRKRTTREITEFSYKLTEFMVPLTVMGRLDLLKDKIKPYIAAGIGINYWYRYDLEKSNLLTDSNDVANYNLTLNPRLGIEYELSSKWRIHAFTQYNLIFIDAKPGESIGSFGIGITRTY